jgi:hypothetical protein
MCYEAQEFVLLVYLSARKPGCVKNTWPPEELPWQDCLDLKASACDKLYSQKGFPANKKAARYGRQTYFYKLPWAYMH